VRDLGLRDATDQEIFVAAQAAGAIVLTKDRDFVHLVERHGAPPHVLWLTCGNTSNARLREILGMALGDALALVGAGERLVEISDA
jgi:predicted nuclease of predicted toxin-antitoxin system